MNKLTIALSGLCLVAGLMSPSVMAADYPPAMNYDNFTDFIKVGKTNSKLLFAWQLYSMRYYLPGRNGQIRIDIVDDTGKIIATRERMHRYTNGQSLGKRSSQLSCKSGSCITMGANSPVLKPGVYWAVFSEHGQIFSQEWFEVRSYKLGQGRFAKGQITYDYLPTTQMARISLEGGELRVEAGFSGGSEVGDQNAVLKKMKATLKQNGKAIAKLPGNSAHNISLGIPTEMHPINLSLIKNNSVIKKSHMKDGRYELDISLNKKAYRKFKFQVKGGKLVYQGRQSESTQPPSRMIVSEKAIWVWNSYAKEPKRTPPTIKF